MWGKSLGRPSARHVRYVVFENCSESRSPEVPSNLFSGSRFGKAEMKTKTYGEFQTANKYLEDKNTLNSAFDRQGFLELLKADLAKDDTTGFVREDCAIYARVSTTDQSTEPQLLDLRAYVKARGWNLYREAEWKTNGRHRHFAAAQGEPESP